MWFAWNTFGAAPLPFESASADRVAPRGVALRRAVRWAGLILFLAALAAAGFYWWTTVRFLQSTDDAYLRADQVTMAPKISGYVSEVLVRENQGVAAGEPLVRIDAANYRAALAREIAMRDARQADVAISEAQLQQQLAAVAQAQAQLAGDEVDARFAAAEAERYRRLAATGAETAEKLAQMVNRRDRSMATLQSDKAALLAAQRQAETTRAQIAQARAQVEAAGASIHEADLDVDNTLVRASIAGRVGDLTVRVGQYVQPGTRLLTLVPVQDIYVIANFKETQLAAMQVGQHASVAVDALNGRRIDAVVESFAPGTGAEFALLPPENATGNFTKIVQRVPVRLRLHTDAPTLARLVPGLSVSVEIDTSQPTPAPAGDR
jgi:membrane fusion protein (multidrug efflux system)